MAVLRKFGRPPMNKRSFFETHFYLDGRSPWSPRSFLGCSGTLKNWAGNVEYGTDRLDSAGSLEQARNSFRKHSRFKVLGTRHCFNHIADSRDGFLSVRSMDKVIALDPAAQYRDEARALATASLAPYLRAGLCAA